VTALVTGAGGFVGSAVVRAVLEAGIPVRALLRRGSDGRNLADLDIERVEGDINSPASLAAAFAGCRYAFHVAADYRLWVPEPQSMYRTNVDGSVNVLEAAANAGVERVVYTSSVAVLGALRSRQPADEETPVAIEDMIGHYKRSKYLAEQAVRRRSAELGLATVIVNPSTPIGPRDIRPTPTGRVILDAARGRMPAYVDTGLNVVHVDDVARGHVEALRRGRTGERYILGGEDLSLKAILAMVARLTGRRAPWLRLPRFCVLPAALVAQATSRLTGNEPRITLDGARMSAKHMYFSSAKARAELGYRARAAEEAIADAVAWFREQRYL
jgi:dihydroflavonol-4-reductase